MTWVVQQFYTPNRDYESVLTPIDDCFRVNSLSLHEVAKYVNCLERLVQKMVTEQLTDMDILDAKELLETDVYRRQRNEQRLS